MEFWALQIGAMGGIVVGFERGLAFLEGGQIAFEGDMLALFEVVLLLSNRGQPRANVHLMPCNIVFRTC